MRRDISRISKKMGKSSDRNIHIVSERLGGAFGGKAEIKKKEESACVRNGGSWRRESRSGNIVQRAEERASAIPW